MAGVIEFRAHRPLGNLASADVPDPHRVVRLLLATAFLASLALLIVVIGAATAQGQTGNDLSDYTAAMAHPALADRLHALESYVRSAPAGATFKVQALTYLVWEYLQTDPARSAQWAAQLQAVDSDNAMALAAVANQARNGAPLDKHAAETVLAETERGLTSLPHLQRPIGMPQAEFEHLRLSAQSMLKGAAGQAELSRKNYTAARNDLRDALAAAPDDARNNYALALAYLQGKDADPKEGYWYLAKAVNLSQGTPQGQQIADYSRNRYRKDGGTDAAWDQFLVATRVPSQTAQPAATELAKAETRPPAPTTSAAGPTKPASPTPRSSTVAAASTGAASTSTTSTSKTSAPAGPVPPPAAGTTSAAVTSAPSVWADDTPRSPELPRKVQPVTTGPVSLGILIETSLADKQNRAALTNSLSDMVRRLGENDEAFILSYSDNLVLEEDLTGDPKQLETALDNIKPEHGAALDDAVAFAAGHLARIGKNARRELLVISDGKNLDSKSSPLTTSAAINAAGVRIYCIGMDVQQLDGRYRLQALSSSTGGSSSFISDPHQLRQATMELARNMGINFRY